MTILQPLLLSGLLLVGLPVVLHLIMQQKPKRLPFPAFRFLAQKRRTNTQRLRLRHLLLLLLRMFVVAGLCFALARPEITNGRFAFVTGTPVAAALVFDTSMSMEYAHNGKTRLEEAQQRARELLDGLPPGSRVAVFDSGDPVSGEWLGQLNLARDRVAALQLRPAAGGLGDSLLQAYRLLAELESDPDQVSHPLPRVLCVFSDRTQECWEPSKLKMLTAERDRIRGKLPALFVDLGVDEPVDVAITEVELPRQRVAANQPVVVKVSVQATGQDCDTEVLCRFDNESNERKPIRLKAGQAQTLTFERGNLGPGVHQAEVALAAADNLPSDNARFATVEVGAAREVLTIADDPAEAVVWTLAIETKGAFKNEVVSTTKAEQMVAEDFSRYQAVCLFSVARPEALWGKLEEYVKAGGGLAVVPGGEELVRDSYSSDKAKAVLPGVLGKLIEAKQRGAAWKYDSAAGPLKQWPLFGDWEYVRVPRRTQRYWEVQPASPSAVVVNYDEEDRPALLERGVGRGRVLLYTTPLDLRRLFPDNGGVRWNDYATSPFYQVIVNEGLGYLAGADADAHLNFVCGEPVALSLPPGLRANTFNIVGPGLDGLAGNVVGADRQSELQVAQAAQPGNYLATAGNNGWKGGFSLNVASGEAQLARVPVEQIEALFGPKAVLPVGHAINLRDAIQGHWGQPVELFPALMVLVLLALAAENLLANKFYRRPATEVPAVVTSEKQA